MMVRVLDKMNKDRKKKIITLADEFIETNTYKSWKIKKLSFVKLVKGPLNGERNGKGIGKM